jgi:glyoxylase-like metal-dependent hydrolase (beta-lactamase superfamily II)
MHKRMTFTIFIFLSACAALFAQVQKTSQAHPWFQLEKINDKVWRIADGDIDNIYLIQGRDSALLIDNGTGAANLRDYLKSITTLPLIVVNTHSHPDHTGSINQFDKIHAHPDDFQMIRFFSTKEMRASLAVTMGLNRVPDSLKFHIKDSSYVPVLAPVSDGYVFDLGDRKVEVIHVPGHTKGSICLLDHKDKLLYTGDNDNTLVWLHPQDAVPLEIYLKSLQKLEHREKQFTTLLPGHGASIDKGFIGEQIECTKRIISGECIGKPYDSFVGKGLVCAYKRAQVVYDPAKIKVKQ